MMISYCHLKKCMKAVKKKNGSAQYLGKNKWIITDGKRDILIEFYLENDKLTFDAGVFREEELIGGIAKTQKSTWGLNPSQYLALKKWRTSKSRVLKLKEEIEKTEKEVDKMVYDLYGLNDEEIKLIEETVGSLG